MTQKHPYTDEGVELHKTRGEIDLQKGAQQLGRVGTIFGSTRNAALYVAGILVFLALIVLLLCVFFIPEIRQDALKAIAAVALAGVGYIAGIGTGGRD